MKKPAKKSSKPKATVKPIKMAELFAGVGGFREAAEHTDLKNYFKVSWSNQWEPSESAKQGDLQNANRVYIAKFGKEGHYTNDVHLITDSEKELPKDIADIDMLVGGFPCQDYSVAKPKNTAKGIRGPKGVLWWSIERILRDVRPNYVLLENVDRLINSPSANRGRDFAVILKGLDSLGYIVEWRIVNAADYGFAQKRRRIFILAYKKNSPASKRIGAIKLDIDDAINSKGLIAKALPCVSKSEKSEFDLTKFTSDDELGAKYKSTAGKSPFFNAGFVINGKVWTKAVKATPPNQTTSLGEILLKTERDTMPTNSDTFRLSTNVLSKWSYAKGRKNEPRRKAITVANFLKSKLGISVPATAAKQLNIDLKMDVAFDFTFNGTTVSVSLAREEINYRIALALNPKSANSERPNAVLRADIELAKSKKNVWNKVEVGAIAIATDRAFSLLGLKRKEQLEQVATEIRTQVVNAVAELVKKEKSIRFSISGKSLEVNRDTLAANTFAYGYKEGGLPFPDRIDGPGRTIITSEGGASVSRFKHVICESCATGKAKHKNTAQCVKGGKLRRLYPEELERMNSFSAVHSKTCRELEISDGKRAFFMGNALVVGLVRKIMESIRTGHFNIA